MNNRSGLVLIGFAVAILGYALLYSGISNLNPCITPTGLPAGVGDSLIPGRLTEMANPNQSGFSSRGGGASPGGGKGGGGIHAGAR